MAQVTLATQQAIAGLYISILGRNPEPAGFGYWCDVLANAGNTQTAINNIAKGFAMSPEFISIYGGQTTNAAVTLMYNNVLQRGPDSGGLAYWAAYANNLITAGSKVGDAYALTGNAIITAAATNNSTDTPLIQSRVSTAITLGTQDAYTLTTNPDTATAIVFNAPKAYTPGGNDLVNTLQNEDVLTGLTSAGVTTSLTGDLGNPNDSGGNVIAPTMTNVQTLNIAFTNTSTPLTLDFQDINGTLTANMTRISNNLRDSFVNLGNDVANLGIANTSEQANATITYLNNELGSAANTVTLTLNNASLSNRNNDDAMFDGGSALRILATEARGSDLQNQIEVYNIVTTGGASTVATFETGDTDYNNVVVGERPQTINITAGASLAIGTLRWQSNRVETFSSNDFLAVGLPQVELNGYGFWNHGEIKAINISGSADVTLANVGDWDTTNEDDSGGTDFALNASALTGRLTADITNATDTTDVDARIQGGSGNDRFYVSSNDVTTQLIGGLGIDSLTVQSVGADLTIDTRAGSGSIEFLNLVAGEDFSGGPDLGDVTYTVDMQAGSGNTVFGAVTVNNQSFFNTLDAQIDNLNLNSQIISVRSQAFDFFNGNPVRDGTDAVLLNVTLNNTTGAAAGTVNIQLGAVTDDRGTSNAFSVRNYTSNVTIDDDNGGTVTAAANLNLVVNTAGDLGTSEAFITVDNVDFSTLTTLSSEQTATNTVSIGEGTAGNQGDYLVYGGSNSLNSTTYSGGTYTGVQNILFGGVLADQAVAKSHNITTGSASDTVDLSYMGTNTSNTAAGFAISSFLLGTVVDTNGGTDELVLSADLADPRNVVLIDETYDQYFAKWFDIETLTINNRNDIGAATVGVASNTEINSANLSTINFNDVSGTFVNGFEFTNNMTVNVNAAGDGEDYVEAQSFKTTTIDFLSLNSITLNVDTSYGVDYSLDEDGVFNEFGNFVVFDSTGGNFTNAAILNYTNITGNGANIDDVTLIVNNGSLDQVNFSGDLGLNVVGGNITVTTGNSWTATGQTTVYNFTGVTNSIVAPATITIDASGESSGLTINGANDNAIQNTITGTAAADIITSGGGLAANTGTAFDQADNINAGAGADSISYTFFPGVNGGVDIVAGSGNDTVTMSGGVTGDIARINAGSGNDTVTVTGEVVTYIFATTNVSGLAIAAAGATIAQTVLNVGVDSISGFNFNPDADGVQLSRTVFGADVGTGAGLGNIQVVATVNTLLAASATGEGNFVAVQSASAANASLYYLQNAAATNQSVDVLVQAGTAILIGSFTNVAGIVTTGDFAFVA